MKKTNIKIALAQLAPVWLDKNATIKKTIRAINNAGKNKANLIVFGEGFLPGYPYWLSITNGSAFNNTMQKEIHSHYVQNAVCIEDGDLDTICKAAKKNKIAVYLGAIERAGDRGGHSLYCALVYINTEGEIKSVHRKLQPTYEERLTWAPGDGNGLVTHNLESFTLGGLNCWENWMPLARTALYAQGENVHIAVWPGSKNNTEEITKFIAKESRSYVISVSSLMHKKDFPKETPHYNAIIKNAPDVLSNGGSCIAMPNGEWLLAPVVNKEDIFYATLDINKVYEERQNFDVVGHYARPDVTQLIINTERQNVLKKN
jgi:nitrilase